MLNTPLLVPVKNKLRRTNKIPFILTFLIIVISYILPRDEFRTVLLFLSLIPIFTIYRFNGRIPIGYAILLIIVAGITVSLGELNSANEIMMSVYWLVIAGCCCLIIEFLRKN